ncbi:MAG: ribbon-helix-helix domain-containing protein [Micromonosporaceae bacterium]
MKLSVSLPEEDVAFVDDYSRRTGSASRSSVIQHAIALLRESNLQDSYAEAFQEWESDTDAAVWEATASDGVAEPGPGDAPR